MARPPAKVVARRTYVHASCFDLLDDEARAQVEAAERRAGVTRNERYNVVRFEPEAHRVALLHYPDFFDAPFPALRESWKVDLESGQAGYRTWEDSLNPPILHRKELLLPDGHPRRAEYVALTEAAESVGLFDDPTRIGFRDQWERLVRERGYRISGHQLVPIGNDESIEGESLPTGEAISVARHLTALVRYGFSAPVQTLARYGFLDGRYTVFDYGCGRGDDVRGLAENGLQAAGWDPHYAAENAIAPAPIVNLGFVINVIEDFDERVEALHRAWGLAEQVLVVAVMLANQNAVEGQRYNDGVLTRRGTFQKYYTQAEIKGFLEEVLDEEPIAVGPGIFYVFRDKDAEQRFLADRFRSRRTLLRHPSRPAIERPPRERRDRAEEKYQVFREPLDRLWEQWLALAREPDKAEVADLLALTEGFGTLGKALRFIAGRNDIAAVEVARQARIADLEVYFALNQFERRKPYKHLEPGLQRDIKEFFGDYATAQQAARELLFRIASPETIDTACRQAAEHGLGWLTEGESLQLHASLVERLPPLLRVYVGCAAVLYGDYRNADLVKVHIRSGKLTLMRFDDFEGRPLPCMVERVKIKLRQQDFDYFGYGEEYEPPFLYRKSRYINEEFPNYPEQVAFDEALDKLGVFDLSGYGPKPSDFLATLETHRWAIDGFNLVRSRTIPDLDAPCGRHFKFRDLIECGETQARTGIPNLPKEPESYNALYDLAVNIETATPFDTPRRMTELVDWFREARSADRLHPLLLIALWVVIFLEIHPFQDGNGRLSRVLTTLLLLHSSYAYVPYSSLESVIEANKEAYYLALRQTQGTIRSDAPDWQSWVVFFLRSLAEQVRRLDAKVERERLVLAPLPALSLQIVEFAREHGRITMGDAMRLTGSSRNTLKVHFRALVERGQLVQEGSGRGAWYRLR